MISRLLSLVSAFVKLLLQLSISCSLCVSLTCSVAFGFEIALNLFVVCALGACLFCRNVLPFSTRQEIERRERISI